MDDPLRARTAPGVLELRYAAERGDLLFQNWVWIPPPEGDAWPRLNFYANVPAEPGGRAVFWEFGRPLAVLDPDCVGGEVAPDCIRDPLRQQILPGGGWRPAGDCLPTDWSERWLRVEIKLRDFDPFEPGKTYDPPVSILLDDFEVTFDEGCAP